MRINVKITIPQIDVEAFTKAQHEAVEIHVRNCARAFVRAALEKVPVDTGMARGSFLNIGRFLRIHIPIKGKKTRLRYRNGRTWVERKRWYYPPNGGPKIPKTPESGAALTAFEFKRVGNTYQFIINSKVFHYTLQDEFAVSTRSGERGGSPSAPWQSMRAGREAWFAEMKNLKKKVPKITDFVTETTISLGPGAAGLTVTKGRLRIRKVDRG